MEHGWRMTLTAGKRDSPESNEDLVHTRGGAVCIGYVVGMPTVSVYGYGRKVYG